MPERKLEGGVTMITVTSARVIEMKKALSAVKGHPVLTPYGEGKLMAVDDDFCLVRFAPGTEINLQGPYFTLVCEASLPVKVPTKNVELKK